MKWWNWFNTKGRTGEEPPEVVKKLFNLTERWAQVPKEREEYMSSGREILTLNVKNLFVIGTVGLAPWPVIIKNNMINSVHEGDIISHEHEIWKPYKADQWFFKK